MTNIGLCGHLEDPQYAICKEALENKGFHVAFVAARKPYAPNDHMYKFEFPHFTYLSRPHHGAKEIFKFIAEHKKVETKVIVHKSIEDMLAKRE